MSSVVDSFRETFNDNFAFFKMVILAIPVYFSYQVYTQSKQNFEDFFWLAGITVFFLFGFLIKVANNVITEENKVLPALNPFTLGFSSIKGIIAVGPIAWISCKLAIYICSLINVLKGFMHTIIWLIVASLIVNSFLMFASKERIIDAFNMKLFFEKTGDLFLVIIFFIIQLIFLNIITTFFIGYILFILFGTGGLLNFFISLVLVFNVAVTGHYLGQVHYETLGFNKES